ncbi:MAG TPA: hypothetical protein P5550_06250 [Bacteroidales bacterium]|nr:hypothetical protein [Bacteroidales bacterium]HRZ77428.1 hypothetical protein [Bacteroidales bacterium]
MNKVLLSLGLLGTAISLQAAILTVSNLPAGGAQYSTLNAAYTAASPGDTLMLQGSNTAYSITGQWNKALVVIGTGVFPDKDNVINAKISSFQFAGGGSGSKFYGVVFQSVVQVAYAFTGLNLYFEACQFNSYVDVNYDQGTWTFVNCLFEQDNYYNVYVNGSSYNVAGLEFRNCVFDGTFLGGNNPGIPWLFDHCLFLASSTAIFTNVRGATISNCIFANRFPEGVTNTTFLNNLCAVSGTFPPAGGGGNSALSNIENSNPLFVNFTSGQLFSTSRDYHLQAGSPAIGAGSDGTDIGLFGGSTGFNLSFEPQNAPVVRRVLIQNPTISPNGILNVNVKASTPRSN